MANAQFNLADLNGRNGFILNGIAGGALSANGDLSGGSVSGVGDINGDGIDDVIIGAELADSNGNPSAGQSYVVFGSRSGFSPSLNLSSLNGSNGFALNGITRYDISGASVSGAGDVNGDGIDDLIIGAPRAEPNGNSNAGQSYVVFGSRNGFSAAFNLSSLNGSNGFAINGIAVGDSSGGSVSGAGDINGDGIDDVIIGARQASSNGNASAGQSYVVFGSRSGFSPSFNLRDLNGGNGFAIGGIKRLDYSGFSVSEAGDINGDGIDDLIIGATGTGAVLQGANQGYVVFGRLSGFNPSLDLSSLNGSNGFAINSIGLADNLGRSVSGAGDINGDGIDDLVISAPEVSPNGRYDAGQSYVVFGRRSGFSAAFNLAELNGSNGFVLNGVAGGDSSSGGDKSGVSVSGVGDVNGDRIDDLIIGASRADPNGNRAAGQSYVLFGRRSGFGASLDLSSLNGSNGFALNGIVEGDYAGNSVSGAGDINGDGIADLIIGAPQADPDGKSRAGQSYVVFGVADAIAQPTLAPPTVNAGDVTLGSINADLNAGVLIINATPPTVTQLIAGFTNVIGTAFGDTLIGNSAANILTGNSGNDAIVGNGGDDLLTGGVGNDSLSGGLGRDRFLFSLGTRFNRSQIGIDAIEDFTRRQDKLVIDPGTFKGVKKISFASVKNVRQAQQSIAQFTYIRKSGALYFNANGNKGGFGKGGQFAELANGFNLTPRDIIVGSA